MLLGGVANVGCSIRMDALTKLFETGLKVGVPNATMRALFTKTRKGRSAGPATHTASPTASTRKAVKAGPTEEQKAEAREKAKKKREEEAAKKKAAAVEAKRKANARKAAKKDEMNAAAAIRKPFESIKVVHEKVIVEKNIPRSSPIPNGFVRVGKSNRGNTIRIRGNLGPQMNNLANRLMKTIKVRRNRK